MSKNIQLPKIVIRNCEQIVQVCCNGENFLAGINQDRLAIIERRTNDDGVGMVVGNDGRIMTIDHDDRINEFLNKFQSIDWETIDGRGCSIVPGLVDAHCHPVWAGDRIQEFDMKLRGASYMEIHEAGGGIHRTVNATKKATEPELYHSLVERIENMMSCGTTALECKTGYGLEYETERKMLSVIRNVQRSQEMEIVSNFLGAHSVPAGMTPEQGVNSVIEMMDRIAKQVPELIPDFVDVFCEKGVYDHDQTEKILRHAQKSFPECKLAFHGDELTDQNSGVLAARLGARSVSHLEYLNEAGMRSMAEKSVAGILCPTTCYLLKLPRPPARQMISYGVPVVVASDYNPNAMCYSLPMAMNLAAVQLGLTLNECLAAVTINAAYALGLENRCGTLEPGKRADFLLLNHSDWRYLVAQFGDVRPVIREVFVNGKPMKKKFSSELT